MSKPQVLQLLEKTSKEACDKLDELCFDLVRKHGFNPKKPRVCKREMKAQNLGVIFNYSFKDEHILLWWEMWTYEGNREVEKIDESKKLDIIASVSRG